MSIFFIDANYIFNTEIILKLVELDYYFPKNLPGYLTEAINAHNYARTYILRRKADYAQKNKKKKYKSPTDPDM